MVAARRIIALPVETEQRQALVEISRSRTEPANRVERARIILAYLAEPSAYAVARAMGVSQQTVTRCLRRAAELVPCAAATPSTRLAVERIPSFAPNTAARNQPICSVRCRSRWRTGILDASFAVSE
jgi:hypothetical protein